ncbi:uncharacterized protein [Prorops nasuta]|uniref:uncharacterized protein n=1 Tax=Prorops nasuta TaxID=863751 RepID=UPI0034CD6CDA
MSDSDKSSGMSVRDREILTERNELRRYAKNMPRSKLIMALTDAELNTRDSSEDQLRDRFVRHRLRESFGPEAAQWNPRVDELEPFHPAVPPQPLPTPSAIKTNDDELATPKTNPKLSRQSEDALRELFESPRGGETSRQINMSEESSDSNLTCIDKNRKLTPKPKRGVTFESDSDRSGFRRHDLDERSSEPPNRTPANPEYSRERNAPVGVGNSALGAVPPELLASIVQLVIADQSAGAQGSAPVERAPEMPQPREISRDSPGTSRGATSRRRQPSEYRSRNRSSSSERLSESSSRYSSRRGTRVIDAFRKWGIRFKNHDADDAEDFIENLEHCRNVSDLTFSEIRETLPVVLSGEAKAWFKVEGSSCSTWRDFREAFLSQFGDEEDNDAKWEKARQQTQREGESIKAYLVRIRSILKEIRPTPSVSVQLDLVYRNLRPNYRRRMFRRDFDSITGLREIVSEKNEKKPEKQKKSDATGKNAKKSDDDKPKKKKSRSRRGKRGKSKRRSSGSTSDSSSGSDSSRESHKKSSKRSSRRHSDKGSRKESSSHSGHHSSSSDELGAIAAAPKQGQQRPTSSSRAPGGHVAGQSRYQDRGGQFRDAAICHRCGGRGHYARECPSREPTQAAITPAPWWAQPAAGMQAPMPPQPVTTPALSYNQAQWPPTTSASTIGLAEEARAGPADNLRKSGRTVRFTDPESWRDSSVSSTDYEHYASESEQKDLRDSSTSESEDEPNSTRPDFSAEDSSEESVYSFTSEVGRRPSLESNPEDSINETEPSSLSDHLCALDELLPKKRTATLGQVGGKGNIIIRTRRCVRSDAFPNQPNTDGRYYLQLELFGQIFPALIDTGASRSYLGHRTLERIQAKIDRSQDRVMRTADGTETRVIGVIALELELGKTEKVMYFRVVPVLDYDCVLGMDFLRLFGVIIDTSRDLWQTRDRVNLRFAKINAASSNETHVSSCFAIAEMTSEQNVVLEKFLSDNFPEIVGPVPATTLVKHHIDVQGQAPIRQAARRVSPVIYKVAHEEVDKLLGEGIIEPSTSAWASCPVIVPNPGGKYRFCIDFRRVNEVTRKDAYPIPHIDSILDKLRHARYISTLDLSQVYFQIPLGDESREITAFIVPGKGLFQFRRMRYGLTNAPATFQRMMDQLIPPEFDPYVFVYLDDIIIVTNTFAEHLGWLERVLNIIRFAGLEINREKSKFCRSQVRFLGYLINLNGLAPDPERTAPLMNYPPPKDLKTLRRFLGMVGWYARFLPNLSKDKIPLVLLLHKGVRWHWNQEQQTSFERLKEALCSAPVLARPDFSRPFQVQTDASDYAIGAVLTQRHGTEEHPIVFANRVLSKEERNYTTTEKECLAVVWAIRKLRPYLEGYHFTVVTDHSSLRWLHNLKDPVGRLGRWALKLQHHSFDVVHRKGALHHVPDALSRALPVGTENECVSAVNEENYGNSSGNLVTQSRIDFESDPWYTARCGKVIQRPRAYPDWKVEGNRLYCHRPDVILESIGRDYDEWKLVLPREARLLALQEAHNNTSAGHAGVQKTHARICKDYYWPGVFKDAVAFVRGCTVCQQHKAVQLAPVGLMGTRVVERPWTVVAGDIMGPFPPSKAQQRYVVDFLDNFSRYVEMRAIRTADAKSILKAFSELVIYRCGSPEIFLCDNGTEFVNKEVTKFLNEHQIRQFTIPPYHAQANPVERVNRVIKTMIRIFVESDHRDWDVHLAEFRFAINSAMHSSTGVSPALLNLGRDPVITPNLRREIEGPRTILRSDPENWVARLKRLPLIHDIVQVEIEKASARQARYYNRGRRDVRYQVGDVVWRRGRPLSSAADNFAAKLAPSYEGPFKIVRVISPVVYELENQGRSNPKVHVSDLKPFVASFCVPDVDEPGEETVAGEGDDDPAPSPKPTGKRKGTPGKRKMSIMDPYLQQVVTHCWLQGIPLPGPLPAVGPPTAYPPLSHHHQPSTPHQPGYSLPPPRYPEQGTPYPPAYHQAQASGYTGPQPADWEAENRRLR